MELHHDQLWHSWSDMPYGDLATPVVRGDMLSIGAKNYAGGNRDRSRGDFASA